MKVNIYNMTPLVVRMKQIDFDCFYKKYITINEN